MCKFVKAWVGVCKQEGVPFCKEHTGKVCFSCGSPATHDCGETMGPCVCGVLLCDDCEHEISSDGTNGGNFKHCKKSDQKFAPWYVREEDLEEWKASKGIKINA